MDEKSFEEICYERNECPYCGGDISGEDSYSRQRCYKCGHRFIRLKTKKINWGLV